MGRIKGDYQKGQTPSTAHWNPTTFLQKCKLEGGREALTYRRAERPKGEGKKHWIPLPHTVQEGSLETEMSAIPVPCAQFGLRRRGGPIGWSSIGPALCEEV